MPYVRTSAFFKSTCSLSILAVALCGTGAANAGALPGHGHYVAGQGSIAKSGQVLTIDQSSRTGIINWKTFSVGKGNSVVFDNAHGATLNRVTGGNMSRIAGALHGTGSVYLINNSGVAVLPTGRIVTQGSFAASSNGADGDGFGAHKRLLFTGGVSGNVVNQGRITSVNGRVDLSGHNVTDSGIIAARNASILAANTARVPGRIEASAVNGRGGHIETSGKHVAFAGAHITGASWLVDPKNLTVTSSAASTIQNTLNNGTNVALRTTASSASGPGNVTTGQGDITIAAPITWSGTASFTLNAYAGVNINDALHLNNKGSLSIKTNQGTMNGALTFGSGGSVTFDNPAAHLIINGDGYTLEKNIASLASDIAAKPQGNFALASNYDAGTHGTYSSSPIPTAFKGTFEGLGNTISNLTITDTTGARVGLFETLGTGGEVRDIGLIKANVTGIANAAYVASLVAANGGTIDNSYASGSVTGGQNEGMVGGLVGFSNHNGRVANSHASTSVTAGDTYESVGGLVGENLGSVASSHASGVVSAGFYGYTGGLVGYNGGTINNTYATGDTSSDYEDYVGGLVGYNETGTVKNSYATGSIAGGYYASAGGLVGYANDGDIIGSHASGDVHGDYEAEIGGLVGYTATSATVSSSFATGNVAGGYYVYGAGGLVGYSEGSITDSYATGNVSGGYESYLGGLAGENYGSIENSHASGRIDGGYDGYNGGLVGYDDGTINNSYASGVVNGGDDGDYTGGLVGYESGAITNSYATGRVYGGYDSTIGGLFGYLDGTVSHSYATGNVISSSDAYVGGLGGDSSGTVTTSYATGDVTETGGDYRTDVGGLIGYNDGTIGRSFATGNVVAVNVEGGGLVGKNDGVIGNSYATGSVTASDSSDIGGLVGYNDTAGKISASYSTGLLTNDDTGYLGGVVGYDNAASGNLTNTYWDKTTSGVGSLVRGAGNINNDTGITGKSDAQLKAGLLTGFKAVVWKLSAGVNGGLPYLKANPPQ